MTPHLNDPNIAGSTYRESVPPYGHASIVGCPDAFENLTIPSRGLDPQESVSNNSRSFNSQGGVPDITGTARVVLHDWNGGAIPYYASPPKRAAADVADAAVVAGWGKEFDVEAVFANETSTVIAGLPSLQEGEYAKLVSIHYLGIRFLGFGCWSRVFLRKSCVECSKAELPSLQEGEYAKLVGDPYSSLCPSVLRFAGFARCGSWRHLLERHRVTWT